MYLSIWFGIVLSTSQSGCSVFEKAPAVASIEKMQVRRAEIVEEPSTPVAKTAKAIINPDSPVPKVPPPGARIQYNSIQTNEMVLAMTFDDGPHRTNTPKLLDLLKARNIKATFFLVGELVKQYPDLVKRILAEGHEIGNHTWNHPILTSISDAKIRSEFQRTADAIREISGYTPHVMRPPGGGINKRISQWVFNELGYSCIMWSVDPMDWKRPGVSVVQNRLINGAHKGAIMLAHDIHAPTITAMPKVFDELLGRGYRFVTVSQLLNIEKQTMPVGMVVRPESTMPPVKDAQGKTKG
jgi:peptidoglycan-N-acetylglucosamine deacetylase